MQMLLSPSSQIKKRIMISLPPIRKPQQTRPLSEFTHLLIFPILTHIPHTTHPSPSKPQVQPFPSPPAHTPIRTSPCSLPTRMHTPYLSLHTRIFFLAVLRTRIHRGPPSEEYYCKKSRWTLMKAPGPPSSASSATRASVCWIRRSRAAEEDLPRETRWGS